MVPDLLGTEYYGLTTNFRHETDTTGDGSEVELRPDSLRIDPVIAIGSGRDRSI